MPKVSLPTLDANLLYRLLRKDNVTHIAGVLRWACIIVVGLACGFIVFHAIRIHRTTKSVLAASEKTENTALNNANATPAEHKADEIDYSPIVKNSIFGPIAPVSANQTTPQTKPAQDLKMSLIGTYTEKGQASYAIIEDTKKNLQEVFTEGETVFDQAKLLAIFPDKVQIEIDGKKSFLVLDDLPSSAPVSSGGVAVVGEDQFLVEEAELDKALENLPLLLTQARAVPYFKDGRAVGLRMFAIKSGSLYEKLGLRNGDILKTINGNSLGDITQAIKLFERLKDERSIGLALERDQEEKNFKYEIR
jgi:general secretion pathway protein C